MPPASAESYRMLPSERALVSTSRLSRSSSTLPVDTNGFFSPRVALKSMNLLLPSVPCPLAVMPKKPKLAVTSTGLGVESDAAPVTDMTSAAVKAGKTMRCMRDPTRGGVAGVVNELAQAAEVGIRRVEDEIPIRESVRAACDMLGFDPLSVANEGKVLIVCGAGDAEAVLDAVRKTELGRGAALVGEAITDHPGKVSMQTSAGGVRMVDIPYGEQLPRIC